MYWTGIPVSLKIYIYQIFSSPLHFNICNHFLVEWWSLCKFSLPFYLRSIWLPWIQKTITNKHIVRGYPHHYEFGYPLHFSISSPFLTEMTFVFVSLLCLLMFGSFGLPRIKETINKQTLWKGINISLGIWVSLTLQHFDLVLVPHWNFRLRNFALLFFFILGRFGYPELKKREQRNSPEGDTHITRDLGIP